MVSDPTIDSAAPDVVKKDLREFISRMRNEAIDLQSLGLRKATRDEVLAELSTALSSDNYPSVRGF